MTDQTKVKQRHSRRRSGSGLIDSLWTWLTGGPAAAAAREASQSHPNKKRQRKMTDQGDASAQDRYDRVVLIMLKRYDIKVRRWRKTMSGVAWVVSARDGSVRRFIEAPQPKGPMSAAVFLHEIGHHAIGFNVYRPRCLEEYHAWAWSLSAMEEHGLAVTDAVHRRMHASLHYAIAKAGRRGLKKLPAELAPFVSKPPARRRRTSSR